MDVPLNPDFVRLQPILPPEVWNLVAKQLLKVGSDDVENLANSSVFFKNLLESQRTIFLFEKVFPLVASSIWEKEGLQGLPVSDVLKLRGVCPHWNAVIDKLIPEQFQHFGKGSEDVEATRVAGAFKSIATKKFSNVARNGGDVNQLMNFLQHFERTHPGHHSKGRNPFIGRNFEVDIRDRDEDENYQHYTYLKRISTLLSRYGHYLDSFSMYIVGYRFFLIGSMLREWFGHTPNLKKISFRSGTDWRFDINLDSNPFPRLNHLECLDTRNFPEIAFNLLIRQNNHLSELIVENLKRGHDLFTFPLPKLRKLKMDNCYAEYIEKLGNPQVQWPLEILKLEFRADWDKGSVGYSSLFQVIQEKFASTLVSLDLEMDIDDSEDGGRKLWEDSINWRLDLPKLKKIKIDMMGYPACLDFLLPMKHNLEEIVVHVYYEDRLVQKATLTSETIIQFMGFEEKMLKSNVWAIFKKLKKMKVKAWLDGYTRKSWRYSREEWMLNNDYA